MRRLAWLPLLLLATATCDGVGEKQNGGRSDAIESASREMSGPSLFSQGALPPALSALRAKAGSKALRLEIRARELLLQVEDPKNPGSVLEYHYRDGKVGEPERASLQGKGALADNLFALEDVKLGSIPELAQAALRRVDAEAGSVDYVLVRRNLPESDDVRLRVYVQSPRQSGYLDADQHGRAL